MIPIYLATAAFVAGLAIGGSGAWKVQAWRHDANELERQQKVAQDARRSAAQGDRAAEAFQARQEAADAREETVSKEVIRVITKTEYRDRCLDDDGMRILAGDATASNARRGLAPALPASAASR